MVMVVVGPPTVPAVREAGQLPLASPLGRLMMESRMRMLTVKVEPMERNQIMKETVVD